MTSTNGLSRRRGARIVVAFIATLAATLVAQAAEPKGGIPRLANGRPDFSGVWQTLTPADFDLEPHGPRKDAPPGVGVVAGNKIPYLPAALEQRKKNFDKRTSDDPALRCWSLGVPRSVYYPAPFQILQRERDLTLIHQLGFQVRTIHTNGSRHPKEGGEELWHGDSRGTWDGDTLVVDVTDFNEETWLDRAGNFHSTDLHVVERWTYLDPNTIEYSARLEDPKVFAKPWDLSVILHRHREKGFELIENYCFTLDYDSYYPPRKD